MKYLSLVRLLAIVAFGLLSSCSEKDESSILKEFEKGPIAALNDKENLKKVGLSVFANYSNWSYNVEKTDSIVSPYTAIINGVASSDGYKMRILMAYQDDKWVFTELGNLLPDEDEWINLRKDEFSGPEQQAELQAIKNILETN